MEKALMGKKGREGRREGEGGKRREGEEKGGEGRERKERMELQHYTFLQYE